MQAIIQAPVGANTAIDGRAAFGREYHEYGFDGFERPSEILVHLCERIMRFRCFRALESLTPDHLICPIVSQDRAGSAIREVLRLPHC
jgi:hypothetical protein